MRRRSSSSGVRLDRLPLDFSARSRTSRRSSGERRFQYFRPWVFNHRIAARTLRHGTFLTAVIACKTHAGIGVALTTPRLERVTTTDSPRRGHERSPAAFPHEALTTSAIRLHANSARDREAAQRPGARPSSLLGLGTPSLPEQVGGRLACRQPFASKGWHDSATRLYNAQAISAQFPTEGREAPGEALWCTPARVRSGPRMGTNGH
jgi:hypothetical protein